MAADDPKSEKGATAYSEILSTFLQTTSVPGLAQFSSPRSVIWKLSWLVLTLLGLAMAVFQSWNVIKDYYSQSIIQHISYESPPVIPMPSITVCSNILLENDTLDEFLASKLKTLTKKATAKDWNFLLGTYPTFDIVYRRFSWYIMELELNESRRLQLCGNIRDERRLLYFRLSGIDSKYFPTSDALEHGWLIEFHNYRFGCCFTINPGFENNPSPPLNGRDYVLEVELSMDVENRRLYPNNVFATVLIHPLGTAPVMGSSEILEVYPGDYTKIVTKLTKVRRFSSNAKCVEEDNLKKRESLALYSKERPYKYTQEACEETCRQNILFGEETLQCVDLSLPMTKEIMASKTIPGRCSTDYAQGHMSGMNFTCDCPVPCKEDIIKSTVVSTSGLIWNAYKHIIRFQSPPNETVDSIFKADLYKTSMLKIVYESSQIEIITEENKYSAADFWGIIGGNLGLWVGLCLLSLIEVIELVYNLAKAWLSKERGAAGSKQQDMLFIMAPAAGNKFTLRSVMSTK